VETLEVKEEGVSVGETGLKVGILKGDSIGLTDGSIVGAIDD
jgi:hypothetical protein